MVIEPVKRWNAIKPHVIISGFTKRKSCDLLLICDRIICIDLIVNIFSVVTVGNVLDFSFKERICERIVSISISTSRYGPRSHCNELIMYVCVEEKCHKGYIANNSIFCDGLLLLFSATQMKKK